MAVVKRPSPALVVAALALFLALVGSGFAATSGHVAAHKRKPKHTAALTAAGVNKLIGTYLRRHKIGRRGRTGAAGATGATGKTGPQGPGAKRIMATMGIATPFVIATVGPWTVRAACEGTGAEVNITGPGDFFETKVSGQPNANASPGLVVAVNNGPLGASGYNAQADATTTTSQQTSTDVQLVSGSTIWELHLQLTASPVSATQTCRVVGSAIPVT
jgi:hypothetical protein